MIEEIAIVCAQGPCSFPIVAKLDVLSPPLLTQCAAVSTQSGSISVPEQMKLFAPHCPGVNDTVHGWNCSLFCVVPPTMYRSVEVDRQETSVVATSASASNGFFMAIASSSIRS